jgi:predicted amidohydrolase
MTPFAIAGMQLGLAAAGGNAERMVARLDVLMHLYPWVQMVVYSELAACGPFPERSETLPGPTEDRFRAAAARHGLWLLPGSLFERKDGLTFNTASVIAPDGTVVARYRKMFPFLPFERGVEAGSEFCTFDVPDVGRFGVSICYDMWFPETSRTLAALGAEVILHPTMTSTIDREVELAIAKATAAVNQCYFVDVNGAGESGNGRSLVVGPQGTVAYQAGDGEELIPVELDLDRVRRSREFGLRGLGQPLKSFRDRRVEFEVYGPDRPLDGFLRTLGAIAKPERGTRVGIRPAPPRPDGAAGPSLFA